MKPLHAQARHALGDFDRWTIRSVPRAQNAARRRARQPGARRGRDPATALTSTVLITGATDGLGRALAARAHGEGRRVLAHGRSDERLAGARGRARRRHVLRADLASLAEVAELVRAVEAATDRLDVVISNAGIGGSEPGGGARQESRDGHELRFAVNYLAGYVLIRGCSGGCARPRRPGSSGRLGGADAARLRRRDAHPALRRHRAYCQSKLAQIMFAFDLADELAGSGVTSTALHPGTYMPTKMVLASGRSPLTPLEQGVDATWRLAADPALDGVTGAYFDGFRRAAARRSGS